MHAPLFVANWKMNLLRDGVRGYARSFRELFAARADGLVDTVICPPAPYLADVGAGLDGLKGVELGAQNGHWLEHGPHTGEVSPMMLKDLGATTVIVGHSERRQLYGETDEFVAKRTKAALAHGLRPIVCVGEAVFFEDANNETYEIVRNQLHRSLAGITADEAARMVIAYEPVWAIGTGRAATPEIVHRMHNFIRRELLVIVEASAMEIPILYGGSTTPENIAAIMSQPSVNGALVGSTSLKPDAFTALIAKGRAAQGIS